MDNLRIALLQADLLWENSEANLNQFNEQLENIHKADLIVLPEMFNTGFTQNVASMAQSISGEARAWMEKKAKEKSATIMGSIIVKEHNQYYNRLIMATPVGEIKCYDKRHLFRMGGEHENFTAGKYQTIFELSNWRIKPLICYDLRFPIWSRNQNNYDLLVYVANWPKPRREVWKTLLKARAIENQCYVIGVNRIGIDGMGIEYAGDSMVVDYKGNIMSELPDGKTGIIETTLLLSALHEFRNKFPVYLDADSFTIHETE
jgi:omega-amidase